MVIAERHRDEFRAVAQYLNGQAELDPERPGIHIWLVEVKAIRIDASRWAPLFDVVEGPNQFTESVAAEKRRARLANTAEFMEALTDQRLRAPIGALLERWMAAPGHRLTLVRSMRRWRPLGRQPAGTESWSAYT